LKKRRKGVSGSFRLWDGIGTFGASVKDEGGPTHYWDMDEVEWTEVPEDDPDPGAPDEGGLEKRLHFGHAAAILKTLDDKGHPSTELIYNMGAGETDVNSAQIVRAVGKKQKHDQAHFGLTNKEANRVGEV